ncbi:four helix bundle protein [Candidatus Margulisiibacteriota bacterium]
MFLFEKLDIYKKALNYCQEILELLVNDNINSNLKDQLYRASTSIVLNIAEGSGRYTQKSKNNFYIYSRGSIYECVAILQILKNQELIEEKVYYKHYALLEELSKMISKLIK